MLFFIFQIVILSLKRASNTLIPHPYGEDNVGCINQPLGAVWFLFINQFNLSNVAYSTTKPLDFSSIKQGQKYTHKL